MSTRQIAAQRRANVIADLMRALEVLANVGKSHADEHSAPYAVGYARSTLINVLTNLGQRPSENPAVIACVQREVEANQRCEALIARLRASEPHTERAAP